jgi:hypothetical protein
VNARPVAAITSSNTAICNGGSTTISGTITASGAWTLTLNNSGGTVTGTGSGSWNKSVSPASTTTYSIASLSDALCASTGADLTGSEQVTVNDLPTFTTSATDITCFSASDGQITVTVTSGASPYYFSKNNGSNYTSPAATSPYTFTGLGPGTHKIRVKDSNGCESTSCL